MNGKRLIPLILVLLMLVPGVLQAEDRIFTFLGPAFSGGVNKITYNDWFDNETGTKKVAGNFYGGGIQLDVFAAPLVGEFIIQYLSNSASETEIAVNHLYFGFTGKYAYYPTSVFALAPGMGLYVETPPASKRYDGGGGFTASLGFIIHFTQDLRFILDAQGRYGSFGMGEDSRKISYGINVGLVYKVGSL